jgi:hypothetical protein
LSARGCAAHDEFLLAAIVQKLKTLALRIVGPPPVQQRPAFRQDPSHGPLVRGERRRCHSLQSQSAICCIAAIKRISHCQRFWIGGPRAYPNCRKVEGRFPAGLTFPLRLLAVADEVIDPNFRNASIEGGEVTLWVIRVV